MNKLITSILLILLVNSCIAQNKETYMGKFMRVFNNKDHRIYKGRLSGLSDSSFFITQSGTKTEVHVREVKLIKFSRSAGHSILIASGACAVGLAVYFPLRAPALDALFSPGLVAAAGFVTGGVVGAPIGALVGVAQQKHIFTINNDIKEWIKVKEHLK